VIGQRFVEGVTDEPSDRQIHLRLAHQAPVVNDAKKKPGKHQAHRSLGIDPGAAFVRAVAVRHRRAQPAQIEHTINADENVIVGEQRAQRSSDKQLGLAPILLPQHLAAHK
jgi:hypothetical protein